MGSDVTHPGVKRGVAVVVSDVTHPEGSGSSGMGSDVTHPGVKVGVV